MKRDQSLELEKRMIEWRQQMHSSPELGFEEKQTAQFISNLLQEFGIDVYQGIGKTGVVGILRNGTSSKSIGIRADIDALPILEHSNLQYRSTNEDVMHACGHDGHTAILLGTACELARTKNFDGTVVFIFQPAEEIGKGALAMMEDGLFDRFPMDEIYALHNMPSISEGTISVREGPIMASEDRFEIEITGKRTHAALPHLGIDPLLISSHIVVSLQSIVSRRLNPLDNAVVSVTEFECDGARNILPNAVELKGDVRSFTPSAQTDIENQMELITKGLCEANGAEYRFSYQHDFIATHNSPEQTHVIKQVAEQVVGKENVDAACQPVMASEDFGFFLKEKPGCYFFLGTAKKDQNNYGLHHQSYDFNDDVLLTGVKMWKTLVSTRLPQ